MSFQNAKKELDIKKKPKDVTTKKGTKKKEDEEESREKT